MSLEAELEKLRTVATHARALVQLADLCEKEKEGSELLPVLARRYVKTMQWLREALHALDAVEGVAESCKTPPV